MRLVLSCFRCEMNIPYFIALHLSALVHRLIFFLPLPSTLTLPRSLALYGARFRQISNFAGRLKFARAIFPRRGGVIAMGVLWRPLFSSAAATRTRGFHPGRWSCLITWNDRRVTSTSRGRIYSLAISSPPSHGPRWPGSTAITRLITALAAHCT